jgi:hypothetical protein
VATPPCCCGIVSDENISLTTFFTCFCVCCVSIFSDSCVVSVLTFEKSALAFFPRFAKSVSVCVCLGGEEGREG